VSEGVLSQTSERPTIENTDLDASDFGNTSVSVVEFRFVRTFVRFAPRNS